MTCPTFLEKYTLIRTGLIGLFLSIILFVENNAYARPNILLIVVDDLYADISVFGNSRISTPNLDNLARRATLFKQAYCSAPSCGPSRASLLTGILPSTSGLYYNSQPIIAEPDVQKKQPVNLPLHFKSNGYTTGLFGKIFHADNQGEKIAKFASPGLFADHRGFWANIPESIKPGLRDYRREGGSNFAWGAVPDDWEDKQQPLVDTENTDRLIQALQQKHEVPFFLCLGYLRPHLPWVVPQRFFDMYSLESISLPAGFIEGDLNDLPECAKWMAHQVPGALLGDSYLQKVIAEAGDWKRAIQAYQACISYVDDQLGRVLRALENGPYADNTIIVLTSDHGYHLGEKEHWTKFGLWEQTLRVPLLIALPGQTTQTVETPVSLIDLYPTLVSLAGIQSPNQALDGIDLAPLLLNPNLSRGRSVISTYGYQNHSIRSMKYRYIRYRNGEEELYFHVKDPFEFQNLAENPEFQQIITSFQKDLPEINLPEASSGSSLGWNPAVFEPGYLYSP